MTGRPGYPRAVDREQIGSLLKRMRVEAGLTQEELAGRLRRTSPYVSKIERGMRGIEMDGIARWARACGAEIELCWRLGGARRTELLVADGPVGVLQELAEALPHLDDEERRLVEAAVRYLTRRVHED